ncbi:hypothetical protein ACO0KY_11115 [Undibacterium sp. Dicai25W]|uniref:hypothetical protein n=1 Tax=Undibacterium sp. Dicai25W TaxID=3413034 RepID=UPI003BF25E28
MAKRFIELDAMADNFRKSDARFPGGDQKLRHFYYGLGSIEGETCGCGGYETLVSFEQKELLVREWLVKKPQSIAAHIVMAKMLINYAWRARGHGYANTVTYNQEKIYKDKLTQAGILMKSLNPKDDPQIYGIYTTIARASSNPRPKLDSIYAEVTKQYPSLFISYSNRADILQEKWFGQPGELSAYIQSLLSSPGGENGKIAYSYVADRLIGQYSWQELYTVTGLTWPLVKEAYATREKKYGMNNNNWNILLSLAVAGRDIPVAKMAIQHIGDDWDSDVWREKKYFTQTVAWVKSH